MFLVPARNQELWRAPLACGRLHVAQNLPPLQLSIDLTSCELGFELSSTGQWFAARTTHPLSADPSAMYTLSTHEAVATDRLVPGRMYTGPRSFVSITWVPLRPRYRQRGMRVRHLSWCAHRNAESRNVSSTMHLLFQDFLLMLCYIAIEPPPKQAQPCGPSIWFIDVSLIFRYRFDMALFLLGPQFTSVGSRLLHHGMSCIPNCVSSFRGFMDRVARVCGLMLATPGHHLNSAGCHVSSSHTSLQGTES